MQVVNIKDVVVLDGRQRKQFDADKAKILRAAIKEVGLMHAIVLRPDGKTLVAGENRLNQVAALAAQGVGIMYDGDEVPVGMIPYSTVSVHGEVLLQKAELMENLGRSDLHWKDKDEALLNIKRLMSAEADGEDVSNWDVAQAYLKAKREVEGQVEDDIAPSTVYKAKDKVNAAELREQYADDPRIQKAKSAAEADKIIKKDLEAKHKQKLAEKFKDVEVVHDIQNGNCCDLIQSLPDNCIDVVVSDPIYGIGAHEMHMFQRYTKNESGDHHEYDDSWENWDKMFDIMPQELFRVCKSQAALYMFCDISRFFDFQIMVEGRKTPKVIPGLATRLARAGWTVWPRPLVWYKGNIGSLPKKDHGPRYTSEYIIYAYKGDKKVTHIAHDVISINQTTGHEHGAGKPPAVYAELLGRSALPGDTVLDFCAGSFPILPAANTIGCKAHAWELDAKWMKNAELRKTEKINE